MQADADKIHVEMLGTCPLPQYHYEEILLGHGSGGGLTADLIKKVFLPAFSNDVLCALEDQASVRIGPEDLAGAGGGGYVERDGGGYVESPGNAPRGGGRGHGNGNGNGHPAGVARSDAALNHAAAAGGQQIAFTTDSFVVRPLFFPGGDIGTLAVCGTVNDLAVGGATPLYLSAAFILEEGLPLADLRRIVASMRRACDEAEVTLVTGDTKVVDRGKGDQVFITTSGIGLLPPGRRLSIGLAQPGDLILVSGSIGDHGIAIMSVREGIEFETVLQSDCAPLMGLARAVMAAAPSLRCMRDPTRGGLSSTLNELAEASNAGVRLTEAALPLRNEVRAACEILGLDPLYVANEGKLVAVVPASEADAALAAMRNHPLGRDAAIIGQVVADHPGMVVMKSLVGGERVVTVIAGEQLPRIC